MARSDVKANDPGETDVQSPTDLEVQLTKYLTDAHSIEVQALAQLRVAPDIAGADVLAAAFREHLSETEGHERETRRLLDDRGASPSSLKDLVMAAGGKGFVLFARLQPDTPGKLLAHALSYEALELASYEMLARVAKAARNDDVAATATRIAGEERAMRDRLAGHVDAAVEAALREHPRDDLAKFVRSYLADAHAIEQQAIGLLERAPKLVEDAELSAVFEHHLAETKRHSEAVEERLHGLGGDPSSLKDAAMRLGALNWTAFFSAHPDTPCKLTVFAYAFEHLEIGGYEQLARVAAKAGDDETVAVVESILAEERGAAEALAGSFDRAAEVSIRIQTS